MSDETLREAAQAATEGWDHYLEAHAGRGHDGPHDQETVLDGGCLGCAGAMYGTEVEMGEYLMPALRTALSARARESILLDGIEATRGCIVHGRAPDEMTDGRCPECDASTLAAPASAPTVDAAALWEALTDRLYLATETGATYETLRAEVDRHRPLIEAALRASARRDETP